MSSPSESDEEQVNWIPVEDCKHGRIYAIKSRNLTYGVFARKSAGFTGIREKFGSLYLFEEYHWDNGPPFGTAKPYLDTGIDIPTWLKITPYFGPICPVCGRGVYRDEWREGCPPKPTDNTEVWDYHLDDDSPACEMGHVVNNKPLYSLLEKVGEERNHSHDIYQGSGSRRDLEWPLNNLYWDEDRAFWEANPELEETWRTETRRIRDAYHEMFGRAYDLEERKPLWPKEISKAKDAEVKAVEDKLKEGFEHTHLSVAEVDALSIEELEERAGYDRVSRDNRPVLT